MIQFLFSIQLNYPNWFILLCLILGVAAAYFHYQGESRFKQWNGNLRRFLALLRAMAVTMISLLLLSPVLKYVQNEIKKPTVLIAQDDIESLNLNTKSEEKSLIPKAIQELKDGLQGDYNIQFVQFGDKIVDSSEIKFNDKSSNIDEVISYMQDVYGDQNPGALILFSDGIYNRGKNPIYNRFADKIPIYSIALGDTTAQKDVWIKNIMYNQIAYLGDKGFVEVDLASYNFTGKNVQLSVDEMTGNAAKRVYTQNITIKNLSFFETIQVPIQYPNAGMRQYKISVSGLDGEKTKLNNTKSIVIEVLDGRQKILMLANSPHPDIAAIKSSIETNKNYQVKTAFISDFKEKITDFDLIVLHQIPSFNFDATNIINQCNQNNKPILYILGGQSNLIKFNEIQKICNIKSGVKSLNEVQALKTSGFNYFTLEETTQNQIMNFIPLQSPYGEYKLGVNAQVLFKQKIGKVATDYPLILFGEQSDQKIGIICAEGVWKWRMFNFMQNNQFSAFDDLISKTIQYLSIKEDKRKFRTYLAKNVWDENENIVFGAELYNDSYQMINDPDVNLSVLDENGKNFTYTFNKKEKGYQLDIGYLRSGLYKYKATTDYNGQHYSAEGKFSVASIQLETTETTADHSLLASLSNQSGGKKVLLNDYREIVQELTTKNQLKPLIYENVFTNPAINLKWIFGLIFLFLAIEWFLRRFMGGY